MNFLVIGRAKKGADTGATAGMLEAEERFAWQAYLDGVLRKHYATDDQSTVVWVLEADGIDAAKPRFAEVPLYNPGFMAPTFHELRPFANWEALVAPANRNATAGPEARA